MNVDTELEVWRQQWQSVTTVPLDLRRKVERQSLFMKIAILADLLVTITIVAPGLLRRRIRRPS